MELEVEQLTVSKLEKEYDKAVYCHPGCLTYIQSTSCKMSGWMNHKLESRFPGETTITSDIQMISFIAESEVELKSFLMKVKGESGKSWLENQHSEN